MHSKKIAVFIAALALAGAMLGPDAARAQDNGTNTVRGKMYICYFFTPDGTQNYELTFSPGAYVSVMDGMGYGLYFTAGSFFASYYLVLNQPMWKAPRPVKPQGDLIDTSDILTIISGVATGPLIQGVGLSWTDFKNGKPLTFIGYQHVAQ